jgi:hypothetical protein
MSKSVDSGNDGSHAEQTDGNGGLPGSGADLRAAFVAQAYEEFFR